VLRRTQTFTTVRFWLFAKGLFPYNNTIEVVTVSFPVENVNDLFKGKFFVQADFKTSAIGIKKVSMVQGVFVAVPSTRIMVEA
jgi:hypothetical protein